MFKGLTRSNGIPVLRAAKQVLEKLLEQEDFDLDDKRQVQIALRNLKALPDQIPISSFKVSVLVLVEMGVIRYSLAINPTHFQLSSEQVLEIEGGQEIQGLYTLSATSTGEFAVHGDLEQWTRGVIDAIDDQENEVRIEVGTNLEMFEEDENNDWSEARSNPAGVMIEQDPCGGFLGSDPCPSWLSLALKKIRDRALRIHSIVQTKPAERKTSP